ncbi:MULTISPECIES: hypothetical protein [Acidianus]|uniref:Uncharacterized protein n=1 Tax=Candidatus Acidianus copahuensis TaxID=1160895 RepID=A0A031LMT4_9CREN|nr:MULTISPECIES: hypothetical protein [Acidianus]EZQ04725.1 hypothetical protein CM19_08390 [Candidatus Acidianus copahuensis]NON63348.1 hypothetical protein [Acidianus sp. RZ1]
MSEELVTPKERALLEIKDYLFDLLDQLNSLIEDNKDILAKNGILPTLLSAIELVTMQKYDLDLVMKIYWNNLYNVILKMNSLPEIKDKLTDIMKDASIINQVKQEANI